MLDLSWGEVMVIGAVALIVIGPKDLPKALRTLGNMTGKLRRMAAEFQSQFNEALREAELDDVRRQVEGINQSVASLNPVQTIRNELKDAVDSTTAGTPGETAAEALAQGRGEANPPAPAEPTVALPGLPSAPPVVDPAQSAVEAVERSVSGGTAAAKPKPDETAQ